MTDSPVYLLRGFCIALDGSNHKNPDLTEIWLKAAISWWPHGDVSNVLQKRWHKTEKERNRLLHLREGLCSYITLWLPEEAWDMKGDYYHAVTSRDFWILFYTLMHHWLSRVKLKQVKRFIQQTADLLFPVDRTMSHLLSRGLVKAALLEESRECITQSLWCWAVFKGLFQFRSWHLPQLFRSK